MADIELVIKIPDKTVNEIKDNAMFDKEIASSIKWDITSAIVNGTPLPKGHGRLIDADWIKNAINNRFIELALDSTPTIIEADKTESEEKE